MEITKRNILKSTLNILENLYFGLIAKMLLKL